MCVVSIKCVTQTRCAGEEDVVRQRHANLKIEMKKPSPPFLFRVFELTIDVIVTQSSVNVPDPG